MAAAVPAEEVPIGIAAYHPACGGAYKEVYHGWYWIPQHFKEPTCKRCAARAENAQPICVAASSRKVRSVYAAVDIQVETRRSKGVVELPPMKLHLMLKK